MKITLPEDISEITLGQYQQYDKLIQRTDLDEFDFIKRKVKIFTQLSYRDIAVMKLTDLTDIVKIIDDALNKESTFVNRFKLSDIEFGFIPNFDDIKAKEFFDLSNYSDDIQNLHNLMAILFRPIVKKDMIGNYKIAEYSGTKEFSELMKQTPLNIVNGALGFFLTLENDIRSYTLRYTSSQEQMREAMQ